MKNLEFEQTIFDHKQVSSAQLRLPNNVCLKNHLCQYSIANALREERENARKRAIKNLSSVLQIDVSNLNQTDHNVIDFLVRNGLTPIAQEFVRSPDVFRREQVKIFKATDQIVKMVNQNTFRSPREEDMEERLVDKLNKLIQDTFK